LNITSIASFVWASATTHSCLVLTPLSMMKNCSIYCYLRRTLHAKLASKINKVIGYF
ncbi:hypothetical protein D046_5679B, partial [Vibrio parahaemolyticus V-223/04]